MVRGLKNSEIEPFWLKKTTFSPPSPLDASTLLLVDFRTNQSTNAHTETCPPIWAPTLILKPNRQFSKKLTTSPLTQNSTFTHRRRSDAVESGYS